MVSRVRLIDADAMIDRLKKWDTKDKTDKALYNFTLNRINEQPTIQPVRHGHWIGYAGTIGNECSVCHTWLDVMQGTAEMNFCPNCGARMDEVK